MLWAEKDPAFGGTAIGAQKLIISLNFNHARPQSRSGKSRSLFHNIYRPGADRLCAHWLQLFKLSNARPTGCPGL